jgi:serine/threonine protein phosphatase PrpC
MLTVAHKNENGGRGEDRVHVEQCGSRTLAVVADGAGATDGGAAAAAMACPIGAERTPADRRMRRKDFREVVFR